MPMWQIGNGAGFHGGVRTRITRACECCMVRHHSSVVGNYHDTVRQNGWVVFSHLLSQRGDQLMIYEGKAITVQILEDGIAELRFDLQGESVNKFNQATLAELKAAVDSIQSNSSITGVIVTS